MRKRILAFVVACLIIISGVVFRSEEVHASTVSYTFETFAERFNPNPETPVFSAFNMKSLYTADGFDVSNVAVRSVANSSYPYQTDSSVNNSWYQSIRDNIPIPTSENYDGVVTDLSHAYVAIYTNGGGSTQPNQFYILLVLGEGSIQLVREQVVSDAPFRYMEFFTDGTSTWNAFGQLGLLSVSSLSNNGYYCLPHGSYYHLANGYLMFTDMSIYLPSSDGYSGFTGYDNNSTDFVPGDADLYDFNYIKTGNYFTGPNDVVPEIIPEYVANAYHYLNFGMDSFYSASGWNGVFHNITFQYNENMVKHPELYSFEFEYYVIYKDSTMSNSSIYEHAPITFTLNEIMTESRLKQISQNRCSVVVSLDNFYNHSDNSSLKETIIDVIHRKTNEDTQYINPSDLFGVVGTYASNLFGSGVSQSGYPVVVPLFENTVEEFEIHGKVRALQSGEDYSSYVNESFYDLISGRNGIVSSQNSINAYPPEENMPSSTIQQPVLEGTVDNGSGGKATAYGGNVYFYNQMGDRFEIPEAYYESLQNAYSYLIDFVNTNSSNSFLAYLTNGFGVLPNFAWGWILAGVSTVTIASTIHYFRKK